MDIRKYLEQNKDIQRYLLVFLENEDDFEDDYRNLLEQLDKQKIKNHKYELSLFLHMLLKITQNHKRGINFITKIEQVLKYLETDIKQSFSNSEIFNIFKDNKRILLFLFENKIIAINEYVIRHIITYKYVNSKYPQYFSPEIKPFIKEKWFPKYKESQEKYWPPENEWVREIEREIPENFYELRTLGENDSYICELIRNDSIKEFIQFVNKNNYSLRSQISHSVYETNSFLIKKQIESNISDKKVTLVEYAAFFGAIQILRYLQYNGVDLTSHLLEFGIHSKNAEIIHLLEEINSDNNCFQFSIETSIIESIKCHHNDFVNYFLDNNDEVSDLFVSKCIEFYNFMFIQDEHLNDESFDLLCKCDYCSLVNTFMSDTNLDINRILV